MRATGLATLFAIVLTAFLVALLPASFALREAEARSGNRFAAFDERGTVWAGSAHLRVATPSGTLAVERLQWRFDIASLLGAQLGFAITARVAGGEVQGIVARGMSGFTATNLRGNADAAALGALLPLAAAWKPEGRIDVVVPTLFYDGRVLQGRGEVLWRDAGLALAQVKPLGSYRLELDAPRGAPAAVTLSTVSGALRLDGKGTLALPGAFALSGSARAQGDQAAALEPVLDLLGPKLPDGSRALELRTR